MNFSDLMDTPRICTAFAEWGACLVYIFILQRRQPALPSSCSDRNMSGALPFRPARNAVFLLIPAGFLILFILWQYAAGLLPLWTWIPCMLGAIFLMYLFLRLLCEGTRRDIFYCCLRAFVLAEFTASLHWQLYVWAALNFEIRRFWSPVTAAVLYPAALLLFFVLERAQFPPKEATLDVNAKELSGAALIALGSFAISNLSFAAPNSPFSSASGSILYVRTLVDFGGLVMLYALQDKREELRMRNENQAMNVILQRQYDQYRLSIDNIELLRREFHDLKHYMIAIRSEQDPTRREQYLQEMEEAIRTQEALTNTGNSVLDVLLTTKNTYCIQKGITFTCMADGRLLSFMHVKDICSVFGNMLDNAIECVSRFSDPEKRLITLNVHQQNRLLIIQCENYTDTNLTLSADQIPFTTKQDRECHGFGLKSIRHAAQKYGGTMTLHAKDHWFTLQIVIPLSETEKIS